MLKRLLLIIFLLLSFVTCYAAILKRIYLDHYHNVHVFDTQGKDLQLTHDGKAMRPSLSEDGTTAAWLVINIITEDEEGKKEEDSSKLAIYRHNQIRYIECGSLIRDFWFALNGKGIATDCGGRHFAGTEILYDINTLKPISKFDQAKVPTENRPSWSSSSDHFDPAATSP